MSRFGLLHLHSHTPLHCYKLLDCFTIPTVLTLSWLFLRVRYKWLHLVGVFVCVLGVGALILADVFVNKYDSVGTNKLVGDLLCLAGAILYGVSNVCQEYVVRSFNRVEFLGMLGLFASIINGIQFAVLERNEVAAVEFSNYEVVLPLLGFGACLFTLYSLMPLVLEVTSATAVNLNLLTADFYALLVGLFVFHDKFHVLYFLSFGLIIIGILLYSIKPPPVPPQDDEYQRMRVDDIDPADTLATSGGSGQYQQQQQPPITGAAGATADDIEQGLNGTSSVHYSKAKRRHGSGKSATLRSRTTSGSSALSLSSSREHAEDERYLISGVEEAPEEENIDEQRMSTLTGDCDSEPES